MTQPPYTPTPQAASARYYAVDTYFATPVRYKSGVVVCTLHPDAAAALYGPIADVYQRVAGKAPTVTSCREGRHMDGSFHYLGRAFDLRIRNVPAWKWKRLAQELRNALGPEWDVVLEVDKLHIHVELDRAGVSRKRIAAKQRSRFNLRRYTRWRPIPEPHIAMTPPAAGAAQ